MEEIIQVHTLNLTGVLSESKRIIKARLSHFITLSLLFLPLSLTLTISPTLHRNFTHNTSNHQKHVIIYHLLYTVIVYVISLCAIGTITYSTHHAFFGEPVNSLDALKSLTFSFVPLASTAIISYVLIVLITLTFLLLVGTGLMLVHNLGFVINYHSVYFMLFSAIMGVILFAVVIYFHVNWSLALMVVVVESKWGFPALMRSWYLLKGMRSVSLLVMLYFGVCVWSFVWICSADFHWAFIFVTSYLMLFLLVRFTAANTVLYNYCKALHGELALDVAEPGGFVHGYMNLAAEDEKVPRMVSVLAA
ncbi:hypothetical protein Hdeb2414_s0025g00662911 [Helianthus debilis subsp. tardiflorus]